MCVYICVHVCMCVICAIVSVKSNARLEGENICIFAIQLYTIAGRITMFETENDRHKKRVDTERRLSGKGIAHFCFDVEVKFIYKENQ